MKTTLFAVFFFLFAVSTFAQKPVVLISGDGDTTIHSQGSAVGGHDWAVGSNTTHVSKHDQTMEMAQNLTQGCPAVDVSLNQEATPDYYLTLNREGGAYDIGRSQFMLLNRNKTVIFVAKKGTVKHAMQSACNAITADWEAHGSLASASPAPSGQTVALDIQTTAKAQKYCKPETIAQVISDTKAYLTEKGVAVGPVAGASYKLTLIIDRPLSKWLKVTVQERDSSGKLLWSEEVSDGGWGHLGSAATLNTLDKIHQMIDSKLGIERGLPLLAEK